MVDKDVERKLMKLTDACDDNDEGALDSRTFYEIRTQTLKDMLKGMIHCDMHHHAMALSKLTVRYNDLQKCTVEEVICMYTCVLLLLICMYTCILLLLICM